MPWELSDDVAKKRRQITKTLSPVLIHSLLMYAEIYPKGGYLSRTKESLLCLRNCSAMLNKQIILKTLPLKTALWELSEGLAVSPLPWFLILSHSNIDLSILLWGLRKDSTEDRWWDVASKPPLLWIMPIKRLEVINGKYSSSGRMLCRFDKWALACFYRDHVARWNKTSVVRIHQKERVNVIYLKLEVKNVFYRAMLGPVHGAQDENTLYLNSTLFKCEFMCILQSTKYLKSEM